MRSLDSVTVQPIPATEDNLVGAAWSPDGRSIAYIVDRKLRRLEIGGGSPQLLTFHSSSLHTRLGPHRGHTVHTG
jgi:WD40-like Beta Propeller Repeat